MIITEKGTVHFTQGDTMDFPEFDPAIPEDNLLFSGTLIEKPRSIDCNPIYVGDGQEAVFPAPLPLLTLRLGSGPKTPKEFQHAFRQAGMEIKSYARSMLIHDKFTVATAETEIDVVSITEAELGF